MPSLTTRLVSDCDQPGETGPFLLEPYKGKLAFAVLLTFGSAISIPTSYNILRSFAGVAWEFWLLAITMPIVWLAMITGSIDSWKQLFNIKPQLTLSKRTLRLGDPVDFRWKFDTDLQPIRKLEIRLIGRKEKAAWLKGEDSSSECRIYDELILETVDPAVISEGQLTLKIPVGGIPTGRSDGFDYSYRLQVWGVCDTWSDVQECYRIQVTR